MKPLPRRSAAPSVMAGPVQAIHVGPPHRPSLQSLGASAKPDRVDGRDKPGPDGKWHGKRTLPVCFSLCAERRSDGERLVDRREHLPHREFVEAAAVTVEAPLATFFPTRSARQGILHEPDIASPLEGAHGIPGRIEPADRPRSPYPRVGRPVERYSRTTLRRGKMRDGRVWSNKDAGGRQQRCDLGPASAVEPSDRCHPVPEIIEVAALGLVRTARCDNHETAIGKRGSKLAPTIARPALVAEHWRGVYYGIGTIRKRRF